MRHAPLFVALTLLAGCASDGAAVKVAPVTGRVIFKNQAFTPAEIYFNPDADKGTQGDMGSALITAADGTFAITTAHAKGPRDGVAPGAYLVTLGLGRRPERELAKYRNVKTTPLKIEVPENGFAELVIDLDKGVIEVK